LNTKWIVTALSLALTMSVAPVALAQKKGSAETSLIGIKLYDTGLRVISVYGTPDSVESVGGGGNAIGPGGGGGGAAGAPGGAGAPSAPGGAGGAAGVAWNDPGDLGNQFLQKAGAGAAPMAPGGGGPPGQGGQGFGPGGGGPPGAGASGGGGSVGGGNSSGRILFTRWIYNRNGSKYGFVLDKSNRVVQIEAIGMSNPKVKTAKGVSFGSTFAQLIKKYNAPDGYEISGDNIVVRFMVRNKVAFRLSRLGPNKPQVVTGIVVAAGKS